MKNCLITGNSGFLGSILVNHLNTALNITTLSRSNADILCDLSESEFKQTETYDTVVHCAGKAHVIPTSKEEEQSFFKVNTTGTENLLKSLVNKPDLFILISTVSVYGKVSGIAINEKEELNPTSPYALSKCKAEELVERWATKNNIRYLVLRLPLIVGPNPPGNLGMMIKYVGTFKYFRIGKGDARKSMVLASDIAQLILDLPKDASGTYNLTDGYHPSFKELEDVIAAHKTVKVKSLPYWVIKIAAMLPFSPIKPGQLEKITSTLIFDDRKARQSLNWRPHNVVDNLNRFISL